MLFLHNVIYCYKLAPRQPSEAFKLEHKEGGSQDDVPTLIHYTTYTGCNSKLRVYWFIFLPSLWMVRLERGLEDEMLI